VTDPHPNATIARKALEAYLRGDLEELLAAFHDDIVWHAPGTNRFSGKFEGKPAVVDRLSRMIREEIRSSFDIHDVVANDDHVVALVRVRIENREGQRYDAPQVQVMHVRDGLIAEYWAMNQDQPVEDLLLGE